MTFKLFLSRTEVKIFIICTVSGGILQVLARRYLKTHPEMLKDAPTDKKESRPRRLLPPYGGAVIEVVGVSIKIGQFALNVLAQYGLLAGAGIGAGTTGAILIARNSVAISVFLRDAFPQNLPDLDKRKFIIVNNEKIYLDQCDQNLKYLFDILDDETIPFEERKELAKSIFMKYLNLKTPSGRLNFVLCTVAIIYILFVNGHSSFYIAMRSLIKAIREGKISKAMARLLIRKLRRKGVPIDPELSELVAS